MSPAARASLGALFGALAMLLIHPASRPYVLGVVNRVPARRLERCIDTYGSPTPPHDLMGASLWLQLAAERIRRRADLRPSEYRTLVQIAEKAAAREPQNAFWYQAETFLHHAQGNSKQAYARWQRAARCDVYNDYQSARLMRDRRNLAIALGSDQSWQLAYLYHERSDSAALLVDRYARFLLSQPEPNPVADLQRRYATLINGDLLRTGAGSVAVGAMGANLVELSVYPKEQMGEQSPKRLIIGQTKMTTDLAAAGREDDAARARKAFRENDSWKSYALAQDPLDLMDELSAVAMLSGTLIGASLFGSAVGALVWLIGWQTSKWLGASPRLSPAVVIPLSLGLAALSFWLTHDLWAGMVSALAGGFLFVAPNHARKALPEDIGPLFSFLLIVIATLCGAALGAFALARAPAAVLLPRLGVPTDLYATLLPLGMACIFFSLALTAVPIWALVQRLGTPHVFGLALRKFGVYLGFGGLVVGILMGPVAVYTDHRIETTLTEIVEREPLYYYLHQ